MDFSKFKTHDWMMVGGGAGFLVFGLGILGWASLGGQSDGSAFDFFLTGTVPWLLIVASAIIAFLLAGGVMKRDGGPPWSIILLASFGLAALLVVIRLLIGPKVDTGFGEVTFDRGAGLYISAIAAIVAAVGAGMSFQAGGGELSDLTDMDKLKDAFDGDNDTPPPPPAQ